MKLTLTLPVKGFISQGFGENDNDSYAVDGLKGHTGLDVVSTYDDIIECAVKNYNTQYTYSLMNKDNPDLQMYRAVFQIVESDDGVFEVSYGHCDNILATIGASTYAMPLATEGNTGEVFSNGVLVSEIQKLSDSHAGFHVHFQVRRLRKVKETTTHCLTTDLTGTPFLKDGFYFDVPCYDNGYNGCISPLQFIGEQSNYKFSRQLEYGNFGTDVYQLQKRLVTLGFGSYTPTGFFGSLTKQSVMLYQEANGIEVVGRMGLLTINSLNQ